MKKLFFILFSAAIIFSCSNESEDPQPIVQDPEAEQYELVLGQWKPYSYTLTTEITSEGIIEKWADYSAEVMIDENFNFDEVVFANGDEYKITPLKYYLRFYDSDRFEFVDISAGDTPKETTWTYYSDLSKSTENEPDGLGFFIKSISGEVGNTSGRILKITSEELIFTQNSGMGKLDQGGYIILRFKRS